MKRDTAKPAGRAAAKGPFAYHCRACDINFEFEVKALPKTVPCPSCGGAKTVKTEAAEGATGTYRYSEALGAVVRVSGRVPRLSKSRGGPRGPSCPPQGCGGCN